MELAWNDGYLLQYFVERGVPVLGVEPAGNVAAGRGEQGVRRMLSSSAWRRRARWRRSDDDLLLGNNVLAHVPDLNDFVGGMEVRLAPRRR